MAWHGIYKDMAFSNNKSDLADCRALQDALHTLCDFVEGRAREIEVVDQLAYLEKRFDQALTVQIRQIRISFKLDDESARIGAAGPAVKSIIFKLKRLGVIV